MLERKHIILLAANRLLLFFHYFHTKEIMQHCVLFLKQLLYFYRKSIIVLRLLIRLTKVRVSIFVFSKGKLGGIRNYE